MGGLITLSPCVAPSLPKGPSEILFPGDEGKKQEMEALSLQNLPTLWFKAALKIATGLCSQAWRPAGKKQTAFILLSGRHSLLALSFLFQVRMPFPASSLIPYSTQFQSPAQILHSLISHHYHHPMVFELPQAFFYISVPNPPILYLG